MCISHHDLNGNGLKFNHTRRRKLSSTDSLSRELRSDHKVQPMAPPSKRFVIFDTGTLKAITLFGAYMIYLTARGSITSIEDLAKNDLMAFQIGQLTQDINEIEKLKAQHLADEINLGWDNQHIEELENEVGMLNNSLTTTVDNTKHLHEVSMDEHAKYEAAHAENVSLKKQLSLKIKDLTMQKASTPLRGNPSKRPSFSEGDIVEIVEKSPFPEHPYYFRPSLVIGSKYDAVTDTHSYSIVKLDHGLVTKNIMPDQISLYKPYGADDGAVECATVDAKHVAAPFIIRSFHSEPGMFIHGSYSIAIRGHEDTERSISLKQMCRWKPEQKITSA